MEKMTGAAPPITVFRRLQQQETTLKALLASPLLAPATPAEKKRLETLLALTLHILYGSELFMGEARRAQQNRAQLLERYPLSGEYYDMQLTPTPFDIPRLLEETDRLCADKRFREPWLKRVWQRVASLSPPAPTGPAPGFLEDYIQAHLTRHRQQKEATLQQISEFLLRYKQELFAIWYAHAHIKSAQGSSPSGSYPKLSYKELLVLVEQHLTTRYFPDQGITAPDLDSLCVELAQEFAIYVERRPREPNALPLLAADHRVLTYDVLAGYQGRTATGHMHLGDDPLYKRLLLNVMRLEELFAKGLVVTPECQHIFQGLYSVLLNLKHSSLFDNYLTSRTPERQAVYSHTRRWPFLTLFLGGSGSLPVLLDQLLTCTADFVTADMYRHELVRYFRGVGGTRYGENSYDYLHLADLHRQVDAQVTHRLETAPLAQTA